MSNLFRDCTAFDQDLSGWDITSLTNATTMFNGATLSTTNYSALLTGWEAGTHQSGVTFHGGNSTYNAAGEVARDALLVDGWLITDGGQLTFSSTWNTSDTSAGSSNAVQVALPLVSDGTYNFVVDWGDSTDDTITAYGDAAKLHTYNSSGNYTINITGQLKGWQFDNAGDKLKISNIANWGVLNLANPSGVAEDNFYGCTNLTINATDALYLPDTTSLVGTFNDCESIVSGGIGMDTWNTSSVTNMSYMFGNCDLFNADISSWNTANVTNMQNMFDQCYDFNQDIGSWNTANVTDMKFMFFLNFDFNQDISSWNTANTMNMSYMFGSCTLFNQDIGSWNTANVTNMQNMFLQAPAFNRDISSWNTANVTIMSNMLSFCTLFNQDIGSWNTANTTNMSNLFYGSPAFNQDLSGWDVTSMTDATNMFRNTALDDANYNPLLISWGAQAVQSGVTFHGGSAKYSPAGKVGRDALLAEGWTITDGGGA
jgi:surface protein